MLTEQRFRRWIIVINALVVCAVNASVTAYCDEQSLTLADAIKLSLRHPSLLAAREFVVQARADVRTASLPPNPSVSVEGGMLPLSRRYTEAEPGGPPELSGGISYPVDWALFGKRSAAASDAEIAVRIAEAEFADMVRLRIAETKLAYYDVLEAHALLALAKETRKDFEQAETAIQNAVAGGGRPRIEANRVSLELHGARREERLAESSRVFAMSRLQALLGNTAPVGSVIVEGTLEGPLSEKPLGINDAFNVALRNRPDILALRQKASKAKQDEIVEKRNAWPETSLGFGVTHQFQEVIGDPDVTAWGVTLEMDLPIFDRNQGNRTKTASVTAQTAYELTAAETALWAEVAQSVQLLNTAFENTTEIMQNDLETALQVRAGFRSAYEAGGRPLIEMLDAQRAYRETYRDYVTCRADYLRALSQYEAVLGKKVIQ